MKRLAIWLGILYTATLALGYLTLTQRDTARAESTRLRATVDSLAAVGARIDTVYRVQRDSFYVRRVTTDTAILSVERWKFDTVRVVEFVAQADSTIRSCSAALLTCEARDAIRLSTIVALDSLNASTARQLVATERRARREKVTWGAAGLALGLLWPR